MEEEGGRATYVASRLQLGAIDRILVEPLPLLKCLLRNPMFLLGIPLQHLWLEFETGGLAKLFDDAVRVVKQVICIDDTNLDSVCMIAIHTVRPIRLTASCNFGPNNAAVFEIVEYAAQFIVSGFAGHEIVEARDLVKGWNCASEIGRDTEFRVADEESKVKGLEKFFWDHGWIARLGLSLVGVQRDFGVHSHAILAIRRSGKASRGGTNPTFVADEGGSNGGWLAAGWDKVVRNVFDKDAFVLMCVSA